MYTEKGLQIHLCLWPISWFHKVQLPLTVTLMQTLTIVHNHSIVGPMVHNQLNPLFPNSNQAPMFHYNAWSAINNTHTCSNIVVTQLIDSLWCYFQGSWEKLPKWPTQFGEIFSPFCCLLEEILNPKGKWKKNSQKILAPFIPVKMAHWEKGC